jgi:hypothetical protein
LLLLLLQYAFISASCISAGFLFYKISGILRLSKISLTSHAITGLVTLTALAQWIALFRPVHLGWAAFLNGIVICIALINTEFKMLLRRLAVRLAKLNILTRIGLGLTILLVALLNSGATLMDDTDSYHIQMIRWIQEYGTVPGIANLHERFGFNSSWFSSIALFTPSSDRNVYTVLNGVISLWLAGGLWISLDSNNEVKGKVAGRAVSGGLLLAICLAAWPLLRGNASMANYDYIALVVSVQLLLELLKNSDPAKCKNRLLEWTLWPCYLCSVRIMNFPLLGMTLLAIGYLIRQRSYLRLTIHAGLAAFIVLPFLARNFMLSGYFFYPSPFLAVLQPDWRVPLPMLENLLRYIKYYNRINPMFQPLQKTEQLAGTSWILPWFKHLFPGDKLLVIPGIAGLCSVFAWREFYSKSSFVLRWFVACLILQTILWFVLAPDPRFIYGVFAVGVLLLLRPFDIFFHPGYHYTRIILTCLLSFFVAGMIAKKMWKEIHYQQLFLPTRLPYPPCDTIRLGTVDAYIPKPILNNWNPRCYALPLPCLYRVEPGLHLRGNTLKEGFSVITDSTGQNKKPTRLWTEIP